MANWYGAARTNYFKVINEERYQVLFNRLTGESPIQDFTKTEDNNTYHAFGSYGDILFADPYGEEICEWNQFLNEMWRILAPDSVFVFTVIGNEKLRYLTGICYVVFPNGRILVNDLAGFAHRTVKRFFGDNYELKLDY